MPLSESGFEEAAKAQGVPAWFNGGNSGAQLTPNLLKSFRQLWTLNANTYVAAPNALPYQIGDTLYLVMVQDGTGSRTVTWDPIYRDPPSGIAAGGGAGTRVSAEFRWDGSSFQCVGGSSAWAIPNQGLPIQPGSLSVSGAGAPAVNVNLTVTPSAGGMTITGQSVTRSP